MKRHDFEIFRDQPVDCPPFLHSIIQSFYYKLFEFTHEIDHDDHFKTIMFVQVFRLRLFRNN